MLASATIFCNLASFCLVLEASTLIVNLAIGLAIGGAESIGREVAVNFSG